jgi:hypothetical protein
MPKAWETGLGVVVIAASLPLLVLSLLVQPYSSIPPQQNLVTICAVLGAALGVGLIHDSSYGSKSDRPQEPGARGRFGVWAVIGTVFVGLVVLSTGLEYLTLGTGAPTLQVALVVVVGIVITSTGILMSRRAA